MLTDDTIGRMSNTSIMIRGGTPGDSCTVDTQYGATLTSLVSQGVQLLASGNAPSKGIGRESDFVDSGLAGWVDCYPSIAAEPYPSGMPWPSARVPDHGELWFRSWQVIRQEGHSATFATTALEAGVRVERQVSWIDRTLEVATVVKSEMPCGVPFVLASHPLFTAATSLWVVLPDSRIRWESSTNWGDHLPSLDLLWPAGSGSLRSWSALPADGSAKVFMPWPGAGIRFGYGDCAWHLVWVDAPESGFLGLWLNRGGIPGERPLHHWAPEATIGASDSLALSRELGAVGHLPPGGKVRMTIRLTPLAP